MPTRETSFKHLNISQQNFSFTLMSSNFMSLRNMFSKSSSRERSFGIVKWGKRISVFMRNSHFQSFKVYLKEFLNIKRTGCSASHKIMLWGSLPGPRQGRSFLLCPDSRIPQAIFQQGITRMKPSSYHMLQYADYRGCANNYPLEDREVTIVLTHLREAG